MLFNRLINVSVLLKAFGGKVLKFFKCLMVRLCLHFLQECKGSTDTDFVSHVQEWRKAGAQLIGGCCRTTPNTIRAISRVLYEHTQVYAAK